MKIYLSGPMRGYPKFNFPAFFEGAALLRNQRHEVISPAEMDVDEDGQECMEEGFIPHPIKHYVIRDINALCEVEAVALLQGWEKSAGALSEAFVAHIWLGLPLYLLSGGTLIKLTAVEFAKALVRKLGVVPWLVTEPLPKEEMKDYV